MNMVGPSIQDAYVSQWLLATILLIEFIFWKFVVCCFARPAGQLGGVGPQGCRLAQAMHLHMNFTNYLREKVFVSLSHWCTGARIT